MSSVAGLVAHIRTPEGRKHLRYLAVSTVFMPIGQVLIVLVHPVVGSYTVASITSAAILTPINFLANRYYVWQVTTRDKLRSQVLVFWVGAMLAISMATWFTFLVEHRVAGRSGLVEHLAVVAAQTAGFGIVWVGRYFVLDRWLFKASHHGQEPDAQVIDELHHEFPI